MTAKAHHSIQSATSEMLELLHVVLYSKQPAQVLTSLQDSSEVKAMKFGLHSRRGRSNEP